MKKTRRKRLVDQLDSLFSLYIRKRDGIVTDGKCVLGCGPIECCSHLITRGKHSVRWSEINATAMCMGANLRHEYQPEIYTSWWIAKYNADAYQRLVRQSNILPRYTILELEELRDKYKMKLEHIHTWDADKIRRYLVGLIIPINGHEGA